MPHSKAKSNTSKDTSQKIGKLSRGLGVGLAGALIAIFLWIPGWLDGWEGKTWDWRARMLAKPGAASHRVRLILVDQPSLDWGKAESGLSWPWPRETYAAMLQFLNRAGAAGVALDILFTEPSAYGVEDDLTLAGAMKPFKGAGLAMHLGSRPKKGKQLSDGAFLPKWQIKGLETALKKVDFPAAGSATLPISELLSADPVLGNVQFQPDDDGVYRRVPCFSVFAGSAVPTLGMTPLFSAGQTVEAAVEKNAVVMAGATVPIDSRGRTILRFRGPIDIYRPVSAAAVIQSELRLLEGGTPVVKPEEFKDAFVLIGFSAPGLYDLRSSPISGVYPGVAIQATLLDNFLSGDFIDDVPAALIVFLSIMVALAGGAGCAFVSSARWIVAVFVFLVSAPVAAGLIAYQAGYWLPVVVLQVAAATSMIFSLALNYAVEGRQKRFIKTAFSQYLSPAVIERLIRQPDLLRLGGERRELTIFFSDLQGFTGISEGLEPEALTHLLNEYLTSMTDIIHEEGGTVDKYEGDAIIAFWNAPIDQPDHSLRCVRAALRCQAELSRMRPVWRQSIGKDLLMRIGINTGPAVVGNLGSRTRFDYTMLGDAVNLAARLEGTNKQFGTYTMISEHTLAALDGAFPVRELSRVGVVGRKEPVRVYEPMFPEEAATRKEDFANFQQGLNAFYEGNFEEAIKIFTATESRDPTAAAYAGKCRQLLQTPPKNWQGVWVMTSK